MAKTGTVVKRDASRLVHMHRNIRMSALQGSVAMLVAKTLTTTNITDIKKIVKMRAMDLIGAARRVQDGAQPRIR